MKKAAYEVRLIKQVTKCKLGLCTSIATAQRTELNVKQIDGVGRIVYTQLWLNILEEQSFFDAEFFRMLLL